MKLNLLEKPPISKPVSYVGIKPVVSMAAEDSGFYNVD